MTGHIPLFPPKLGHSLWVYEWGIVLQVWYKNNSAAEMGKWVPSFVLALLQHCGMLHLDCSILKGLAMIFAA